MSRKLTTPLLLFVLAFTGCSYTSQLSKREMAYSYFTELLDSADHISDDADKKIYFNENLKKQFPKKKARTDNVNMLLELNHTKQQSDTTASFMSGICEAGFFLRSFDEETKTEMFYRFETPNAQGIGKMVLSDRYRNGFFDEQSAKNSNYIKEFNYCFPRIYFIRKNEIHILSGGCDLTDRKIFKRMKVQSDTIFYKTSTFRKNNNDEIYDVSYSFKYIRYREIEDRWKSVAASKTDSTILTKDLVDYISYAALKSIMQQKNIAASTMGINLSDSTIKGHWFYAGTINALNQWDENNTTIETVKDLDSYRTDSSKTLEIRKMLYVREKPPGEYKADKTSQEYKGDINNSLAPKQKVSVSEIRKIKDQKGNGSVWMRLRDL